MPADFSISPHPMYAVGADAGVTPLVRVFDAETNEQLWSIVPFGPRYKGGVRVAMGDVTGDGVADLIVGTGKGGGNRIRVLDLATHHLVHGRLSNLITFANSEARGVSVAAGDVDGDGRSDVIVGTEGTKQAQVKIFSGATGKLLRKMGSFGLDVSDLHVAARVHERHDFDIAGGIHVASGDVNGDGHSDVIVSTAPGALTRLAAYDGGNGKLLYMFMPFGVADRRGATIAAGDINGDHYADVIVGHETGDTWVKLFSGKNTVSTWNVLAFPGSTKGVRVAAVDANLDGRLGILAGEGSTGTNIKVLWPTGGPHVGERAPLGTNYNHGLFVAGDSRPAAAGSAAAVHPYVLPTVSITSLQNGIEGSSTHVKFRVSRTGDTSNNLTVYLTQGGTASPSEDLGSVTNVILFSGESTSDVDLTVYDDSEFEGTETVTVSINSSTEYGIGPDGIAARIINDDDSPQLGPPHGESCPTCGGNGDLATEKRVIEDDDWQVIGGGSGLGVKMPTIGPSAPTGDEGFFNGGIRNSDGAPQLCLDCLESAGFGQPGGITLSRATAPGTDATSFAGNNWVVNELPQLRTDAARVMMRGTGTSTRMFGPVDESGFHPPRDFSQDTLKENTSNKEFTLVTSTGKKLVFNSFDASLGTYEKGAIKSIADQNGNTTTVTSRTSDGKPAELQRSTTIGGTTTTESYLFAYISSGTNAGKIESITLRRQVGSGSWTTIRETDYTYYTGTESTGFDNGTAGDLKTAIVKNAANDVLDTQYFRYWKTDTTTSYTGGLKYIVKGASYERLKAADSTPEDAADTLVGGFANDYFEYEQGHRVTKHVQQGTGCSSCTGGLGTTTYAYKTSPFADGYNSWRYKTVQTRADGNTLTVYSNFINQPILKVYKDTTSNTEWELYRRYDSAGRLVLAAAPSAISGYDEGYEDLLHNQSGDYEYLRNSQGLIKVGTYGTSTTATSSSAGNVLGYLYQTKLKRGETGTEILQSTTDYFSRSDGTNTIYPVADETVYRNSDGSGGQVTSFSYNWASGTLRPTDVTTTLPAVTTAQNGSNSSDSVIVVNDSRGRPVWSKDQAGFISYVEYDDVTGGVTKSIQDVDTSQTSTFSNLPTGWSTPSGGGLHLTTTYEVDSLGRATKVTDLNGNIAYIVNLDASHERRIYGGWDSTNNVPTGPTFVQREDRAHAYLETLTMSATPHLTSSKPDGTESISGIQSLSRQVLNDAGQTIYVDQYVDLTSITYSQSSVTLGTSGTNYLRTTYGYDDLGRLARTVTPSATIYRTVFDGQGRPVSQWVGTDDTPSSGEWSPSNMSGTDLVKLSENEYDAGGVGDSLLTKTTQFPGGGAANRVTAMSYDWRDRQVATKSGVETSESTSLNRPITYSVMDNLGEVTESYAYDGDGLSITTDANSDGVPDQPSSTYLRAKSTSSFDELGRVYQSNTYSVDPSNGNVSTNSLISKSWYNSRGMVEKSTSPGGMVSKSAFDGAGRTTASYITDGGGDSGYSDADDVTSDNVLSQVEYTYDAGSNVIMTVSRERFHDETGTSGLGTPTGGVHARVSYSTAYFDKANRLTDSVDVGTNGGSSYTRPSTVPSRSDTVLVTSYGYNSAGLVSDVTDPRGLLSKTYYDLAGRTTKSIENYVNGTVSDDDDKTVEYTYDLSNQIATLKADLTGGGYQETKWVYGITSPIHSNDVLLEMRYPDASSGAASSSEKDSFTYNQLGNTLTKTDRNGNVHTYTFDVLGRQTSDAITTLGSGVDGAVRRIETAYDTQGNAYLFTSYDAATGGNIVNQIQREFNGLGQLITEWQAVGGAVNTSTTPKVQYAYSFTASGSMNHSRPTSITYPNGRVITFNYTTGLDDNISRLSSITDGSTTLESYTYLGFATMVKRAHAQPGMDLTFIKQTGESNGDAGDQYIGLDRFGRIADQRWRTSSTELDRRQYGYDRDGNRLYMDNQVSSSNSELYAYDGLNQITSFQRGTLNGTKTGLTGSASRSQSWDFDATGNFDSQTTDGTGQSRSHNKQNEITSIASATTPTYDANGNMTGDETGRQFVYDAWNRLVIVKNSGGTTLATYAYDALGRRVRETRGSTTTDLFYSDQWQVLEERVGSDVKLSYVWSPVYVDAMICRDRDTDGNGSLDERLYVVHDANFNVIALVDTSGAVVERFAYDAFGVFTVLTPSWGSRSSSSYAWIYLHQGGRWDADGGFYNFRHREYKPTLARWLVPDPWGLNTAELNAMRYINNNPLGLLDPAGTVATKWEAVAEVDVWDNNNFVGDLKIGTIRVKTHFTEENGDFFDEGYDQLDSPWSVPNLKRYSEVVFRKSATVKSKALDCPCREIQVWYAVKEKQNEAKNYATAAFKFEVCPLGAEGVVSTQPAVLDGTNWGRTHYKQLYDSGWQLDLSTADVYFGGFVLWVNKEAVAGLHPSGNDKPLP